MNKDQFEFKYLPAFSTYILNNKLNEFVTIGIRFCKEENLPLMKPLSKLSEQELVDLSTISNQHILESLSENKIAYYIENNLEKWIDNKIGLVDKNEIELADIAILYYIRRKLFSYFLYGYTQNAALQQSIINEVDAYTSREELLALKMYMSIQKEIN